MSVFCYERSGKLPNYFYPEILKVDLGDFKITDEFISDTAEISDKESRMLAEMLSKFCKDGSCPEDTMTSGEKVNALWSKYKLALYVDKRNKYVDTMEVDPKHYLQPLTFSLGDDCYDLGLYYEDEDPLYDELRDIKEEFLALKHFGCEYRRYTYTHRYSCSNVMEYSRNVLTELRKIRKHLVKNKVDSDIYDGWLLDEVIEQLETIIEYGRLIKNKVKRNDFLRTFDFGFFNTWKEKIEDVDISEDIYREMNTHLVDYNLGGDPKYDED